MTVGYTLGLDPNVISWDGCEANACPKTNAAKKRLERVRERVVKARKERLDACIEPERMSFLTDPTQQQTNKTTGMDRLKRFNYALENLAEKRSYSQLIMHRSFTLAIIRSIFKDDFNEHLDEIMELFETDVFQSEVFAITPRRFGKTWAVAMFVVAALYAIEEVNISIYSTGRRASKALLDLCYSFVCKLPGMKESVIIKNQENLWIRGPNGPTDIRKLNSYPSKVR